MNCPYIGTRPLLPNLTENTDTKFSYPVMLFCFGRPDGVLDEGTIALTIAGVLVRTARAPKDHGTVCLCYVVPAEQTFKVVYTSATEKSLTVYPLNIQQF